jgi:hypothetical protein
MMSQMDIAFLTLEDVFTFGHQQMISFSISTNKTL